MNAPNKIYLSKDLFRWSFGSPSDKTDIEYINKKELIKWLNTCKKWDDDIPIQCIIDKLENFNE